MIPVRPSLPPQWLESRPPCLGRPGCFEIVIIIRIIISFIIMIIIIIIIIILITIIITIVIIIMFLSRVNCHRNWA